MANNEHRVLKNNTFEDWRQKSNEVSFDVGDNALLDNTRLGDKVYNYTASAGQVFLSGNDTASKTLVIQKLPDATIDNTGGYIILAHGTTVPGAFVNGATVTQGSDYSATIESVVTVDNKSKILVKNSTGTFSASTNLTVGSASIAHANVERIVSESFSKGSIRIKKGGNELVQDLSQAGFHIANHKGTIALTGSPSVDKVTEGITIYQASANQTTQAGVEANATWWATVLHSNTTRIKTKNNNGSFDSGEDIKILGYNPSSAKVDASKVSSLSLNDDSVLHTIELNNEASNSDAFVVITTNLVDAVNELQDDIGTVENLATSTQADVVSAINEIEGVFDASTKEISAGSSTFNVTSGAFNIDSSDDITLDADGGDIFLKDGGTQFAKFTQMLGGLAIGVGSGDDIPILVSTTKTTFFKDIQLGDDEKLIIGDGASGNLQVFHDGTNSYLDDIAEGNLILRTNGESVKMKAGSEDMVVATKDGAVDLYHNGAKKLETKADGVDVTGELQSDSLDVDGVANISGAVTLQTSATVGTTLGVTGLSTLGSLTVTGATQLNGGLDMDSGKFSVANGTGNTIIDGTLNVDGAVDIDSTLDVLNGTTLRSTLDVTGNTGIDGNFDINTNKFNVASGTGNTLIAGTLGVTGNVSVGSLTTSSQHVKGAINELQSEIGSAVFTGDITNGAASVTAAIGLIETEIGDDEAYNVGGSITYGGNTISAALVSLNNGMKANDTEIQALEDLTLTAGNGLSGGGTLSADRSFAVNVDDSSIEINSDSLRVKALGITNGMLAGSIANGKLSNSAITINSQAISLGGSHTFTTANIGEQTNLYFTNERVDDRVADFLREGDAINLAENDNDNTLHIHVKDTIAGNGLAWNDSNKSINVTETGNSGITVNANDIAVDSTVLRTNVNGTVASGITLTVAGSLDLSNASVTFPSGGSGSVQNVGTQFLSITAGQTEQGLKIDRSEIDNSHTIDPAIQWDNAKASDIGWEVVYPNPADDAALSASLVTFENAGKLIGQGTSNTELGIAVTWDDSSNTFDFNVNDPVLTFTSSTFRSSGNLGQATITNLGNTSFALTANQLDLGYNEQIKLGGSDELKIYNNNTNSIIESSDNVVVKSNDIEINSIAGHNMITATAGGAVELYYSNENKLQTKSDGVNVSGEVQATSLDINGNADISGDLTLGGNLNITGNINKQTVTDLDVTDKTITVGVGQNATSSTGSGLLVAGPSTQPSFLWNNSNNRWESNKNISAGTFIGALSGNATTATTASAVAWNNVTSKPTLDNFSKWVLQADAGNNLDVESLDVIDFQGGTSITTTANANGVSIDVTNNSIGALQLDVSGDGSAGQALISDGDGTMSWSTISGDNTTYDLSVVQTGGTNANPILRLDPSSGSNDDITFTGAGGVSIDRISDTEIKITGANTYTLPEATATVRGGVELFSDTDQSVAANSVSSTAGRTYGIQLNSAGQMVVNVPWVDTNTNTNTQNQYSVSIPNSTTKLRLSGSGHNGNTTDDIEFVGSGATTVTRTNDSKFTISSTDTNTTYGKATADTLGLIEVGFSTNASNRNYAVQLDGNDAYVNVPWSDTNTTYSTANSTTLGLVKTGFSTNASNRNYAVQLSNGQMYVNVPWSDTNTDTNTQNQYAVSIPASTTKLRLSGSGHNGNTTDDIEFVGDGATTVTRVNDSKFKISSTDTNTDTNTTYTAGTGLSLSTTQFNANVHATQQTINHGTPSAVGSRTYAVQVDGSDNLVVNVPWSDTNTDTNTTNWNFKTDTHATNSVNISAGETIDYIGGDNITTSHSGNDITIDCDISNVYDRVSIQNLTGQTTKATYTASGINDGIIFRDGSNVTITGGGDDIIVISATNTTYSAGTGLDLSGTTFSIEHDLVGEVTKVGSSGSMHIDMSNNGYIDVKNAGSPDTVEFKFESDGDFKADGDIIAFSSSTNSDIKLKDNIQKVEGALELVSQLDGVTFNWKKDGKASAGVIAQNVEEVLPSAVKDVESLNEDDTHKVVDYNQLSALFIEAIKELKEENKLLKAEIESLKDINNR